MQELKFTVSKNDLLFHLTKVSRAVQDKVTIPAYMFILFEVEEKKLTLTGANSEIEIRTSLELSTSSGSLPFCVDKSIVNILKTLPEHPIEFEVTQKPNENPKLAPHVEVNMIHSSGNISISGMDAKDYIKMKEVDGKSFSMDLQKLKDGMYYTKKFAGTDPDVPAMNAIYVDIRPESIVFFGGTNHQVSRFEDKSISGVDCDSFIFSLSAVNITSALFESSNSDEVKITSNTGNISFEFGGTKVISRLVVGKYPNYDRTIPKENNIKLTVDSKSISVAINRLLVASGIKQLVKLEVSPLLTTLRAQNSINAKYAQEVLEGQSTGDIIIGVNGENIQEAMGFIPGNALFEFSDPMRAVIIKPEIQGENTEHIYMTMPLTLK